MANPKPQDSPFDKRAQYKSRRSALLSEAARLFNTQGSGATTLKQVAAELSLTKTSLYYYVQTKQDLIYQCYLDTCEFFEQLITHCQTLPGSGRDRVKYFVQRSIGVWADIAEGQHPHIALLDSNDALPSALREDIRQRYAQHFNGLVELLRGGIEDGSIRGGDPVFIAVGINGAVTWMPRWLMTLPADEIRRAQAATVDIFFGGIANATHYTFQSLDYSSEDTQAATSFDKQSLQERKRQAFLQAGISMFNSRGYDHTSLEALAESLGVTKGAFYYHVPSKPDLLRQCVNHAFDLLQQIYDQNSAVQVSGAQLLERYCRHLFFYQNSPPGPLLRYNLMTHLAPDDWTEMEPRVATVLEQLESCLQRGVDDHSLRSVDLDVLRRVVMGMTLSCLNIAHWQTRQDTVSAQSIDYFQWLFSGLSAESNASH